MSNSETTIDDRSVRKFSEELWRPLECILRENDKVINGVKEIKTIATWYKEAGEHPDEVPSIIINQCIDKLVESVQPYFANYLIDTINLKIKLHPDNIEVKVLEFDFATKPYIEYVKMVNKAEVNKIRVTFSVNLSAKLEGVKVVSQPRARQFFIDRLTSSLTVSIMKADVSMLSMPIISLRQSVELCNRKLFHLENISFGTPRG